VLIKDGVGYAVAGYQAESGIHACAFEPKTGKVIWEKHDAGVGKGNPQKAMTNGGGVAIAEDRFCLAGWSSGSFDLKTGDWKTSGGGEFGGEVGVLCNRWVLRGGRRLTEPQSAIGSPLNGGFQNGVPGVTSLPVWDSELVVFESRGGLLAAPTGNYVYWKTEGKLPTPPTPTKPAEVPGTAGTAPAPAAPASKPTPPKLTDFMSWVTPNVQGMPASIALAGNMAVAAFADARYGHKAVAFRRSDGSKAWSLDLPDQPAMNRLAVDRDGRVLVSLCDGSVICMGR
jgi:hypothetical protein